MAFSKHGSLDPHGAAILRRTIITNDVVTTVQDSYKRASGFGALGTTGALVFGHVTGILNGEVGVTTSGVAGAGEGTFVGTFTAAADNQTVAMVEAECDISKMTLYSAELDATVGTTTGSDLANYRMDLVDEDTLDESTAHATTSLQYSSWGLDPNNSARVIVNIHESEVFGV